jgi:hypothetical protein
MTTTYKMPSANRGLASLIYFNYMDAPSARLVQDTLHLKKFMEGYDCKVLLKRQETPSFLDLSEKDEKLADVMLPPTRTNFFAQMIDLAAKGYMIDVFLFCHGWTTCFGGKNVVDAGEDRIDNDDITAYLAPAKTGFACMPIRCVWGTDCVGHVRNPLWLGVGALTVSGSQGTNFYPNGAGNFIDDWNKGNVSFDRAVGDADTDVVRTVVQTYLAYVDAPAQKKAGKWGGCKFGKTVLGDDECAKEYFTKCWALGDLWQAGKSGKEMMNISSFKFRGGDKTLTKNSVPKWS